MLSAGLYKLISGYAPATAWSSAWSIPNGATGRRSGATGRRDHPLFRFLNEMAWGTEVVRRGADADPADALLGASAILAELRVHRDPDPARVSLRDGDRLLPAVRAGRRRVDRRLRAVCRGCPAACRQAGAPLPGSVQAALTACFWAYLLLLPLVARRACSTTSSRTSGCRAPLQRALDLHEPSG